MVITQGDQSLRLLRELVCGSLDGLDRIVDDVVLQGMSPASTTCCVPKGWISRSGSLANRPCPMADPDRAESRTRPVAGADVERRSHDCPVPFVNLIYPGSRA